MSSGWLNYTEPLKHKGVKVCRHLFREVQTRRTSSNLLEPLQCRENTVRSGLSQEFGVVRLYRTTQAQEEEGVYGT